MNRRQDIISPREFENLSVEQQTNYLNTLFDIVVDEDELDHDEEEEAAGETSYIGPVDAWDNEEELTVQTENIFEEEYLDEECLRSDEQIYDSDEDEIDNTGNVSTEKYISRSGIEWQKSPLNIHQAQAHNIVRTRCGPARTTNMKSRAETFKCFMSADIGDLIIRHTNRKARSTYEGINGNNPTKKPLVWKDMDLAEFYAFIGVIIMIGANKPTNNAPLSDEECHTNVSGKTCPLCYT